MSLQYQILIIIQIVNSATKDVVATPDLIDHNKLKAVDAVDAMPVKEQTKAPEKQISHPNVNNDRISNLDLENRLLKNELQSLNEELVSITGRLNEQQKGEGFYLNKVIDTQ